MRLPSTLMCVSVLVTGCGKNTEPAPAERAAPPPAPSASADTGRSAREPDWIFDNEDPAKDYGGRYIRATQRYGSETGCVTPGRSQFRGNDSVVEVRNPPGGSCGKAGGLRETFVANVSTDRLRLDDPGHHAALKPWPDGSLPDGPPNPVLSIQDLRKWRTSLHDAVKAQELYPLRIQLYGRGTYPIFTIAGWHGAYDPKLDVSGLRPGAEILCKANNGAPLAFFAGVDRTTLLRIDCPDRPRWEKLD